MFHVHLLLAVINSIQGQSYFGRHLGIGVERWMLRFNSMVVLPGKDNGWGCHISPFSFMRHLMNTHQEGVGGRGYTARHCRSSSSSGSFLNQCMICLAKRQISNGAKWEDSETQCGLCGLKIIKVHQKHGPMNSLFHILSLHSWHSVLNGDPPSYVHLSVWPCLEKGYLQT